jgi:antitoxin MazE
MACNKAMSDRTKDVGRLNRCPTCGEGLVNDQLELSKGTYVNVDICPSCQEEWPRATDIERLFQRKAFRAGGSLAVRIPAEIAAKFGIQEGSRVSFQISERGVLIRPE